MHFQTALQARQSWKAGHSMAEKKTTKKKAASPKKAEKKAAPKAASKSEKKSARKAEAGKKDATEAKKKEASGKGEEVGEKKELKEKKAWREKGEEAGGKEIVKEKPVVKQPRKVTGKKPYHWVEYKPEEIEQLVITLANAGHTPSEIGMMLRDQHGIPGIKKVTGLTVEGVLAKHNLLGDIPRDLLNLIRKSVNLQKHMKTHRKDFTSKRGYQLTVSKIRRLVKYYQKTGKLPEGWRYTEETAALLVK